MPVSSTPVVLICAAPGTQLSSIVESIADDAKRPHWDLEKTLATEYHSKYSNFQPGSGPAERRGGSEGSSIPSMYTVIRRPRRELYAKWRKHCSNILGNIRAAEFAEARLLCMHLTWYHPETREFFSAVNLRTLHNENSPIIHIVILIDDIYDMYHRLNRPINLYDDNAQKFLRDGFAKLAGDKTEIGSTTQSRNSLSGAQLQREQQYRVQGIELALGELMAWRRAEMIQAENIARTLGCDLTVLGTKHSRESLVHLVSHPDAPRVYMSHRITELRKANKASRKGLDDIGSWAPVADEVNLLHRLFVQRGQILINPTAIDELRYDNLDDGGRRSPRLVPRWPLPEGDTMYATPPGTDGQHLEILVGGLPPNNEISSSAARSLSDRIYVEIPFRDHVIVENTPNLCVFRPFYCTDTKAATTGAKWSGGVGPEIEHWQRYSSERVKPVSSEAPTSGGPDSQTPVRDLTTQIYQRRIAFVNSVLEIEGRIKYLTNDPPSEGKVEFVGTIRRHMEKTLTEWLSGLGMSSENPQVLEYVEARNELFVDQRGSTHLRGGHMPDFMHKYPALLLEAVHASFFAAYYHAFTIMDRPRARTRSVEDEALVTMSDWIKTVSSMSPDVRFFVVHENSTREVTALEILADSLCVFFKGPDSVSNDLDKIDLSAGEGEEAHNEKFWRVCIESFQRISSGSIGEFAAATVSVPYDQLCQLANREPLRL